MQIGKEEIKLPLLADGIILYVGKLKTPSRTFKTNKQIQ